jgi:hypothetical protein
MNEYFSFATTYACHHSHSHLLAWTVKLAPDVSTFTPPRMILKFDSLVFKFNCFEFFVISHRPSSLPPFHNISTSFDYLLVDFPHLFDHVLIPAAKSSSCNDDTFFHFQRDSLAHIKY